MFFQVEVQVALPEEAPVADFADKRLLVANVGPLVDKNDSPVPAGEQAVWAAVLPLPLLGMLAAQVPVQKTQRREAAATKSASALGGLKSAPRSCSPRGFSVIQLQCDWP